jgi:hypothetical protein
MSPEKDNTSAPQRLGRKPPSVEPTKTPIQTNDLVLTNVLKKFLTNPAITGDVDIGNAQGLDNATFATR